MQPACRYVAKTRNSHTPQERNAYNGKKSIFSFSTRSYFSCIRCAILCIGKRFPDSEATTNDYNLYRAQFLMWMHIVIAHRRVLQEHYHIVILIILTQFYIWTWLELVSDERLQTRKMHTCDRLKNTIPVPLEISTEIQCQCVDRNPP